MGHWVAGLFQPFLGWWLHSVLQQQELNSPELSQRQGGTLGSVPGSALSGLFLLPSHHTLPGSSQGSVAYFEAGTDPWNEETAQDLLQTFSCLNEGWSRGDL